MENQIIGDIARRVASTGRLTETAELQAEALKEQGYSPERILAEVRKTLNADSKYMSEVAYQTKEYKAEVAEIIRETVEEAKQMNNYLVSQAGMMSYRDDLSIWKEHGVDLKNDNVLSQLIAAYTKQTEGALENITGTTGALSLNGATLKNAFRHELDLAIIKTVSGGFSFNKALDDCCHNLARNGVQVIYPSNRKISIEAAARMCIKTGISQLSGKITEANLKKTKTNLVYVSAHAGARPEHAKWQGKVYTYDGEPTPQYPDFEEETGYGSVTGLKGVNCSHEFYPHWEGDPIPEFKEPEPMEYNGKEYTFYEATQEQRRMERKARELQREIEAQRAAKNYDKLSELNALKNKNLSDYLDFSMATGLNPKLSRMNIYEMPSLRIMNKINLFPTHTDIASGLPFFIQEKIYKKQMVELDKKLDLICKRTSKWNGNVKVKLMKDLGESDEEGNIRLKPNSTLATRYHELLHMRSIFHFNDFEFKNSSKLEEAIVDWLSNELAKKDGANYEDIAYIKEVNALKTIVESCNINNKDNVFLIDLLNKEPDERRNVLGKAIENYINSGKGSNDDNKKLLTCLNDLQGDIYE